MNKINESEKVTFGQAWKDFWKGYFDFKGISTRSGFWWGALIFAVCEFLIGFIKGFIYGFAAGFGFGVNVGVINTIYYILLIVIIIPILAAATRRFRDSGLKEGLIIVLVIAYIALRILCMVSSIIFLWITFIFNVTMIVLLCMPTGKFSK